jgi:hypothetical protein
MLAWPARALSDAEWEPPMARVAGELELALASAPESAVANEWCSTRSHFCRCRVAVAAASLSMLALHYGPSLARPPYDALLAAGSTPADGYQDRPPAARRRF